MIKGATMFDFKSLFTPEELRAIDRDYILWYRINDLGLREKFVRLLKELGAYDHDKSL